VIVASSVLYFASPDIVVYIIQMEFDAKAPECAHSLDKFQPLCTPEEWVHRLGHHLQVKGSSANEVMKKLKEKTDCSTEACVLESREAKAALDTGDLLRKYFKPKGPKNTFEWLSNTEIDDTLDQIEAKNPEFLHITFHMRDFQDVNLGANVSLTSLNFYDYYQRGYRMFGVVFNTDTSKGAGVHWLAVFGDFRDKKNMTIEYFDSAANAPMGEVQSWMAKSSQEWGRDFGEPIKVVITSKFVHQRDSHSCGVYALYYIMSRVEGIPYSYFVENKVPDSVMHQFRKYLFRE
jgi:hypothetical protein